jgi:hypothetical protein
MGGVFFNDCARNDSASGVQIDDRRGAVAVKLLRLESQHSGHVRAAAHAKHEHG